MRILLVLLSTTLGAVLPLSVGGVAEAAPKPTTGSWQWWKNVDCAKGEECVGASHLVGFNVPSARKVDLRVAGARCADTIVSADLADQAPVRIKKGTVRTAVDFDQHETTYTLRLKMTFKSAKRAKGWYRISGGDCDDTRTSFVARPGGYYLRVG